MVQVIKLLVVQSSPISCHFLPLSSKYCPQQQDRPSFTPIQAPSKVTAFYTL